MKNSIIYGAINAEGWLSNPQPLNPGRKLLRRDGVVALDVPTCYMYVYSVGTKYAAVTPLKIKIKL